MDANQNEGMARMSLAVAFISLYLNCTTKDDLKKEKESRARQEAATQAAIIELRGNR